ncbi:MAG: hypothetical protein MUE41_07190 [Gemmatimonadaceae bacterium]|jgi:hypothetical protein|nr:hypothetical protein [Gemmatimonadaceae bacterium]
MIVQPPPAPPPVLAAPTVPAVTASVSPDSVTVGDPFTLVIAVEVAPGVMVRFPAEPDSATTVALRAPADIPAEGQRMPNGRTMWRARYPLAAWDVGALPIPIGPVTIGTRTVPVFARVFVKSVLPADSAQRVPQPPRAPVAWPRPWWLSWVIGAAIALAVAGLLTLLARWRRARPVPRVRAIAAARAEWAALDPAASLAIGEYVHAVDGAGDVLRRYVRRRWAETALLDGLSLEAGATTGEFVRRLREVGWPAAARLEQVLQAIDAARFDPTPVDASRARAIVDVVAPLLEEMEGALVAREAAPVRKAA